MTYAPATLVTLGDYLFVHSAVNLGIVGDTAHQATGTSYHLGKSALTATAYSRQTARDKAGLTEAASAIDIGKINGTLTELQAFSRWFVGQCRRNAPGTSDIREFIYSPDGVTVLRWDRERGFASDPKAGEASASHTGHSHTSWYRDSEMRDKIAPFRGWFEGGDMRLTTIKGEDWTPTTGASGASNGVLREQPITSAPIVARIPAGTPVRSIAEITTTAATDSNWRLTEHLGRPMYLLRRDWNPLAAGGDPAVDQGLTDYIARKPPVVCPPPLDCTPLVNAARQEGVTAGLRDGARAVKDAAVNEAVLYGG